MLASPVPTQTIRGSDGATATSPMAADGALSNIGAQVVPSFSVFHSPPDAEAA